MAITITQNPAPLSFAGNPVVFKVETDTYLEDAGSYSVSHVGLVNTGNEFVIQEGSTLSLNIDSHNYIFTFANSTSPVTGVLPINKLNEHNNYAESLIAFFEENYFIKKNYTLTVNPSNNKQVIFTSKQKNGRYDISGIGNLNEGVEFEVNIITNGAKEVFLSNRYVRADVYIEDQYKSEEYRFFAGIEQTIINSNTLYFDLSSRLNAYFKSKNSKSNIGFNGLKRIDAINKRYYVVFSEYYASAYETTAITTTSPVLRIHKGGIKEDEFRLFPNLVEDYLLPHLKPPSWRPARRSITEGMVDHLYYLKHYTFHATISCRVKFFFSNNTTQTVNDSTITNAANYETFAWNVSYNRIAALATIPAGESIVAYACYWKNVNDADICEPVYYYVEERTQLDRYFYYESSFGLFELLKTSSRHSYGVNIKKNEQSVHVPNEADYNTGNLLSNTIEFTEDYKGSTGNINNAEALVAVDFLLSPLRFLKRGNRLINIIVSTNRATAYTDDGFPNGFNFNYKRANKQQFFSDLIGVDFKDEDPNPGADAAVGGLTPGGNE